MRVGIGFYFSATLTENADYPNAISYNLATQYMSRHVDAGSNKDNKFYCQLGSV